MFKVIGSYTVAYCYFWMKDEEARIHVHIDVQAYDEDHATLVVF